MMKLNNKFERPVGNLFMACFVICSVIIASIILFVPFFSKLAASIQGILNKETLGLALLIFIAAVTICALVLTVKMGRGHNKDQQIQR